MRASLLFLASVFTAALVADSPSVPDYVLRSRLITGLLLCAPIADLLDIAEKSRNARSESYNLEK